MKFVIQRVTRASVTSENQVIGSIGKGFLVLIGVGQNDTRENADALLRAVEAGAYACGAFCGQTLVGYLLLLPERFGSRGQYMELKELYVSEPFRGRGIGRELFGRGAAYARTAGASKLYISAHSSRESQAAYRRWGCVEAAEPDRERAAREPCDVQMEYPLGGTPAEVRVIEDIGGGAS